MNRRRMLLISPTLVAVSVLPRSVVADDATVRYMQWTGYHWVEIVDGMITNVHTGDEWVELLDESLDVNRAEVPHG